jgi:hypothetical protein
MTMPHSDWPRTLEWIEKQAQESLKARFATAEILAKETQTTLTVLLAGIGGSAAYAAKNFEPGPSGPVEIAAAVACVYLVLLSVLLVVVCMMLKSYPAQYQDPENLLHPAHSIDEIREEEIKNIGVRIKEAAEINAKRANHLNRFRIAVALSPLVFVVTAALVPQRPPVTVDKTKIACKVDRPASGAAEMRIDCEIAK